MGPSISRSLRTAHNRWLIIQHRGYICSLHDSHSIKPTFISDASQSASTAQESDYRYKLKTNANHLVFNTYFVLRRPEVEVPFNKTIFITKNAICRVFRLFHWTTKRDGLRRCDGFIEIFKECRVMIRKSISENRFSPLAINTDRHLLLSPFPTMRARSDRSASHHNRRNTIRPNNKQSFRSLYQRSASPNSEAETSDSTKCPKEPQMNLKHD